MKKEEDEKTTLLHDSQEAMDDLICGLIETLLKRGYDTRSIGGWVADTIDTTSATEIV